MCSSWEMYKWNSYSHTHLWPTRPSWSPYISHAYTYTCFHCHSTSNTFHNFGRVWTKATLLLSLVPSKSYVCQCDCLRVFAMNTAMIPSVTYWPHNTLKTYTIDYIWIWGGASFVLPEWKKNNQRHTTHNGQNDTTKFNGFHLARIRWMDRVVAFFFRLFLIFCSFFCHGRMIDGCVCENVSLFDSGLHSHFQANQLMALLLRLLQKLFRANIPSYK